MTDDEIIKALECCGTYCCNECFYYNDDLCIENMSKQAIDLINRQKAEVESVRRKALLEAVRKFAGHSDYHGDTILCILKCMAEGKEVKTARPLNKKEIKTEAIKEFAERLKENYNVIFGRKAVSIADINSLVKEMTEEKEREN